MTNKDGLIFSPEYIVVFWNFYFVEVNVFKVLTEWNVSPSNSLTAVPDYIDTSILEGVMGFN